MAIIHSELVDPTPIDLIQAKLLLFSMGVLTEQILLDQYGMRNRFAQCNQMLNGNYEQDCCPLFRGCNLRDARHLQLQTSSE